MSKRYGFQIRQLDAWWYGVEGWQINDSFDLGTFFTKAKSEERAFLHALHKRGIVLQRGKCRIVYDGDCYVIETRKSGEPLFIAVPLNF